MAAVEPRHVRLQFARVFQVVDQAGSIHPEGVDAASDVDSREHGERRMRFQRGVGAADAQSAEVEPQRRGRGREMIAREAQTDLGDQVGAEHHRVAENR